MVIVYPLRDCFTTKGYAVPNNVYLAFNLLVVHVFATQHNAITRLSEPIRNQIIKVHRVKLKIDTVMPSLNKLPTSTNLISDHRKSK